MDEGEFVRAELPPEDLDTESSDEAAGEVFDTAA